MEKLSFSTDVVEAWTDYNGHFNVAYYALAFDQCATHFWSKHGILAPLPVQRVAISYAEEAHVGSQLSFEWRVIRIFTHSGSQTEVISRIAMFANDGAAPIAVQERRERLPAAIASDALDLLTPVDVDPHSPRGWDALVTMD